MHSHNSFRAPPVAPVIAIDFKPLLFAILTASIRFLLLPEVVMGINISLLDPSACNSLEKIFL